MSGRRRLVLVGGGIAFLVWFLTWFPTSNRMLIVGRLIVTVENRTSLPLTHGSYGPGGNGKFGPVWKGLDSIPPDGSVTHALPVPGYSNWLIHYRLLGRFDDTVGFGAAWGGGVKHVWIVAEGESLRCDSTTHIYR